MSKAKTKTKQQALGRDQIALLYSENLSTTQDLLVVTPDQTKGWLAPPFQRPLRINQRIQELAEVLYKEKGVLGGGPIRLGVWEDKTYLIDGQHRREAFLISGLTEMLVRTETTAYPDGPKGFEAMANDYLLISTPLVNQRPDDKLKAFATISPRLQFLERECPYIGYDSVRRSERAPVLSMSSTLRAWVISAAEVPTSCCPPALQNAANLTEDEAKQLAEFLNLAYVAWGRDFESRRLWAGLNLTLCMWLYRRIVLLPAFTHMRSVRLTPEAFGKCLFAVGASDAYADWLPGRTLGDRARSPAYGRLRDIFVRRIKEETGKKVQMPAPAWAPGWGGVSFEKQKKGD